MADSIKVVQETNTKSYSQLKNKLKMQNSNLIKFIKVNKKNFLFYFYKLKNFLQTKVLRDHPDDSLVVTMKGLDADTEEKPK